jgi:uncharacterized protein
MPRFGPLEAHLRQRVLDRLTDTLAGHEPVVFAYAHGSFIRGDAFRDIDVAIWTTPAAGHRVDLELSVALSQAVGYPVDVRVVNHAPVPFLFHVLRGRLLLARDEPLLSDLMERTARTYHDMAPLLRLATREAFAA